MSKIVLFADEKDCCGCGACMNACPKDAIRMREDAHGFIYPVINADLCVGCEACVKACPYQNSPDCHPAKFVYAAAARDEATLGRSASGGAFAVLADKILREKGVVYGSALVFENGRLDPRHIRIESAEDIHLLQGSKYVQSEIGGAYRQARQDLISGKNVLFTGTPCQIAGFRQYLNKEYSNLVTADIICHGVPSKKLFQEFMDFYGKELGGKINAFSFRDKSKGQGMATRCTCQDSSGNQKESVKSGYLMAYIFFFLKSYTYRINCYSCPFARPERTADLTLGDYWGFHKEYPQYRDAQGLSNSRGISCVLVNSEKGKEIWDACREQFISMPSEFEKVARHNDQLNKPSIYHRNRETVLQTFEKEGYAGLERLYRQSFKTDYFKYSLSEMLPKGLKRSITRLIGHLNRLKGT